MLKRAFLILFVICSVSFADSQPASEASIRQLLEVTNAHKLVDSIMNQMDGAMKGGLQQALHGQSLNPQQQKIIQDMQTKMMAIFKEELSWEKLEPIYLKEYRETLTQEEVDGLLAFYKTPAGLAMINKMPILMQRSMGDVQKTMGPMIERLKQLQSQTMQDLAAAAAAPAPKP